VWLAKYCPTLLFSFFSSSLLQNMLVKARLLLQISLENTIWQTYYLPCKVLQTISLIRNCKITKEKNLRLLMMKLQFSTLFFKDISNVFSANKWYKLLYQHFILSDTIRQTSIILKHLNRDVSIRQHAQY
jgi:hypothetical protein